VRIRFQFHAGGLPATVELATRAGITRDVRALDAGSGLGGPSRFLSESIGCRVTGVDLAPAYVAVATLLAERAGLGDRLSYRARSILDAGAGWLAQQQQQRGPLTTGMVVGERTREMVENFARSLREGRMRLVMGICQTASASAARR
jgi:SAM-dependent methyltransferase